MKKQIQTKVSVEWALLCSQSLIDNNTNNISLVNLIEQIKFEGEMKDKVKGFNHETGEMIPVSMELVSRFRKLAEANEPLNLQSRVDFVDPDSKVMATFTNEILLDVGVQNYRMRYGMQGLKVTKSGLYNFVINLKEADEKDFTEFSRVPLDLTLVIK